MALVSLGFVLKGYAWATGAAATGITAGNIYRYKKAHSDNKINYSILKRSVTKGISYAYFLPFWPKTCINDSNFFNNMTILDLPKNNAQTFYVTNKTKFVITVSVDKDDDNSDNNNGYGGYVPPQAYSLLPQKVTC